MYHLTKKTLELLQNLGLEGPNKIKVFDSSEKGFVIGLGMSKDEAIERGILEVNPLWALCKKNGCIPHEWIKKNLSEDLYTRFLSFMVGQGQSEYGVWATDMKQFLRMEGL